MAPALAPGPSLLYFIFKTNQCHGAGFKRSRFILVEPEPSEPELFEPEPLPLEPELLELWSTRSLSHIIILLGSSKIMRLRLFSTDLSYLFENSIFSFFLSAINMVKTKIEARARFHSTS
jgi:hypothetical protein